MRPIEHNAKRTATIISAFLVVNFILSASLLFLYIS
jgi:hypothetical protein